MDLIRILEEYFHDLDSKQILKRKKSCEELLVLIEQQRTVEKLKNDQYLWQKMFTNIQNCLIKEGERKIDELNKKGQISNYNHPITELFSIFIKKTIEQNIRFDIGKLMNFIVKTLENDVFRRCYEQIFLKLLLNHFLSNKQLLCLFTKKIWIDLYKFLKSSISTTIDTNHLQCISIIIKLGPKYSFPTHLLRDEFDFIENLCKRITPASSRSHQETIVEIAYEFLLHTAMDCRKASCKLGEEILNNLLELYEFNGRQDQLKQQLIKLILLQINIHHPYGSLRDNPLSFAVNWTKWFNCLPLIYNLLIKEIEYNCKLKFKNPSIFLTKNQNIVILLDSFVELFVEVIYQLILNKIDVAVSIEVSSLEPVEKRRKTMICYKIDDLIEKIQETKFWPWIDLTLSVIEKYPQIITNKQLTNLLKILTNLQIENTQDTDLKYYLYKSFCIIAKLEYQIVDNNNNNNVEIDTCWNTIIKSVLSSIGGATDNDKYIQELLQILIKNNQINQYEGLLQNYKINILKATEYNLQTLNLIFTNYLNTNNINNNDQNIIKKDLIIWIFDNLKLTNILTTIMNLGKFLICLILKQWPDYQKIQHFEDSKGFDDNLDEFTQIQEIYLKVSLEKYTTTTTTTTTFKQSQLDSNNFNYCMDTDLYNFVLNQIKTNFDFTNIENSLNSVIFIYTTINYLLEFNLIVKNDDVEEDGIFKLFETNFIAILERITDEFPLDNEQNLNNFYKKIIKKLQYLFKININKLILKQLHQLSNERFLRFLFNILELENNNDDIDDDINVIKSLKLSVMEILGNYCFNSCTNNFTNNQKRALSAILQRHYDLTDSIDYQMIMTFLQCLYNADFNDLPEDILLMVYNQITSLCEYYYQSSINSKEILQLYRQIYKIFINNTLTQTEMINLLEVFYNQQKIYSPIVVIALLNCMRTVYELSPNSQLIRWQNNQEIILKIPEFLIHNSINVRFTAIEIIGNFFQISSKSTNLTNYHQQELMFSKIQNIVDQIFNVELTSSSSSSTSTSTSTEIRLVDETTTRISTVLQIYSTIMLNSNLWLQEALFELLAIANKRRFSNDLLLTTIEKLSQYFGYGNRKEFLGKYLKHLYEKWYRSQIPIGDFPYFLLINEQNCNKFHQKYYKDLIVILMEIDTNILEKLSELEDKTTNQIYEEISPQLITTIVLKHDTTIDNGILKNTQLFWQKFNEICINLLDYLYDERDFCERFNLTVYFTKFPLKQITVDEFLNCLKYFDNFYQQSIVANLLENYPQHIHQILLNLKILIYNNVDCNIEEKFRYFHQFTVIVEVFLNKLKKEHQISDYLLTNLINYLLNLIKTKTELRQLSCRFLKRIIDLIYPEYVEILQIYFPVIVSNLKTFKNHFDDGDNNVETILEFFLIKNSQIFNDSIFYQNELEKLEFTEQINEFLKFYKKVNYFDLDNLKYLRKLLVNNKHKFLDNLEILQQLICILIQIIRTTTTPTNNTTIESMRCLGELGPINLQKLILQPEQSLDNTELTINELITGHLLSLLSKYQFDDNNPYLIDNICKCLYELVQTKDAKKLIRNQYNFGYGILNSSNFYPFSIDKSCNNKKLKFLHDIDVELFETTVDSSELWLKSNSYEDWILTLTTTILQTCRNSQFYVNLIEICKLNLQFLESILPLIILVLITTNTKRISGVICEKLQEFFANHWCITVNNPDKIGNITINENSIKCMLNVVNFVRLETNIRPVRLTPISCD